MSLFRKKHSRTPLIAAFVGGTVVALAGVAYVTSRLLRKKAQAPQEDTDFTDTYIPPGMKRGSRRAVHAMV